MFHASHEMIENFDSIHLSLDALVAEYIKYRGQNYYDNIVPKDKMSSTEKLSMAMEMGKSAKLSHG